MSPPPVKKNNLLFLDNAKKRKITSAYFLCTFSSIFNGDLPMSSFILVEIMHMHLFSRWWLKTIYGAVLKTTNATYPLCKLPHRLLYQKTRYIVQHEVSLLPSSINVEVKKSINFQVHHPIPKREGAPRLIARLIKHTTLNWRTTVGIRTQVPIGFQV